MSILAQYYYESSTTEIPLTDGQLVAIAAVSIALGVILVISMWRLFTKAGQPGWHAIVPFLNTYTLIKVAGRPGWWLLLYFVPCVNYVVAFIVLYDVAKAFGRSSAFGVGTALLSPIFIPVLAFGPSEHYSADSRDRDRHRAPPPTWSAAPAGIAAPSANPWPRPGAPGTAPLGHSASPPPLPSMPTIPTAAPVADPPPTPAPIEPAPAAPAPVPNAAPVAGWYADPGGSGQLRYWDGSTWTEHLH